MKGKLTKKEKNAIMEWLCFDGDYKSSTCPFSPVYSNQCMKICDFYFPKVTENSCPCTVYALKTVVRRAKQMLEDGE